MKIRHDPGHDRASAGHVRIADAAMPSKERSAHAHPQTFSIVGVGASAGGFEAFSQLLEALPADPDLAIVFVQHLAPQHQSALSALLSAHSRMRVIEVKDGMRLERNHVYVVPPNAEMELVDGRLHLTPRTHQSRARFSATSAAAAVQQPSYGVRRRASTAADRLTAPDRSAPPS